jgi:molybdopterin converting factor subunit 1
MFLYFNRPWADWFALTLFVLAAITDFFDGYLARLWKQESRIGAMLDPIADKAMVVIAIMVITGYSGMNPWLILPATVILFREVFVSGLREYLGNASGQLKVTIWPNGRPPPRWSRSRCCFWAPALPISRRVAPPAQAKAMCRRVCPGHGGRHMVRAGADLGRGRADRHDRLGLFPQVAAALLGMSAMIDVLYFAWVRERIGLPRERWKPTATTVNELVAELVAREDRYAAAFADISALRVALDQDLSDFDAPLAGVREVAFFPPMTGG